MLTKSIEVMKYVRASAGRAGISIVFESINQPRHDGKTIYLPKITTTTTDLELQELMASVDHEVAHDRFSSFEVLKEKKIDPKGLLLFVWNFLEDSRVNTIEALEYRGFRENWDETSSLLVENILVRAKKEESVMSKLVTALICWETRLSASNFPKLELVASTASPDKKVMDVLNNFSDRLVHSHTILDKRLGTEATFNLAVDILKKLDKDLKTEFEKEKKASEEDKASKDKSKKDSAPSSEGGETKSGGEISDSSSKEDGETTKNDDDEYKVINIKLTEEDLASFSITLPDEDSSMGKVGVNFEPVKSTYDNWEMTDYSKFIVVDYPKNIGESVFFTENKAYQEFLNDYNKDVHPKLVSQENFAQQVRRLIQIRAKVQRQYGVKKGKLDQSRLSRICFNAPGFNERVFKNKIENKTLDASITVLVDMSGSMMGMKAYYALASTLLVNEVCSTLNIPVEIIGFTDGVSHEDRSYSSSWEPLMYVYKNFSDTKVNEEVLKHYFALSSKHMVGNPDGENILWAHDRLLKRKEKKRLLIVMSDGSPAATKCSAGLGEFTLKIIQEIEKTKAIDIYGLGLCSDSVKYYYKSNSVVNDPEQIPSKLLELIERKILNV